MEPAVVKFYMKLIGILHWMCLLGWIHIFTEVFMFSSYLAMQHEGHLEITLHVFLFLKSYSNSRFIFTQMCPWWEIFVSSTGQTSMLEPLKPFCPIHWSSWGREPWYVCSWIVIMQVTWLANAPILVLSSSSIMIPTIETSVFGAEFCVMRHGTEALHGIRYRLYMMTVPVMCLVTICWLSPMRVGLSPHSERSQMQYATMHCGKLLWARYW